MNKVMAMTALAAGLLVSTAAISAPANLADAFALEGGVTLVHAAGGGGQMGAGAGHMGGAPWGGAGARFSGGDHLGGGGRPPGAGTHFGANDHFDNGRGHFDRDHGRRGRFIPGNVFVYGGYGDYDYGYSGDCNWLRRQATVTGSRYWWRRYQACLY